MVVDVCGVVGQYKTIANGMFNYDIRVQQSDPDRVSATNQPIKISMSCVNGNESIFISDLIQLESTDFPEMPPQP